MKVFVRLLRTERSTQELVLIASDAYMLADMDDAALAQQLPQGGRLAPDTLTTLRNICLALLSAAMQWSEFRWDALLLLFPTGMLFWAPQFLGEGGMQSPLHGQAWC